jgi:hypothetical protein
MYLVPGILSLKARPDPRLLALLQIKLLRPLAALVNWGKRQDATPLLEEKR